MIQNDSNKDDRVVYGFCQVNVMNLKTRFEGEVYDNTFNPFTPNVTSTYRVSSVSIPHKRFCRIYPVSTIGCAIRSHSLQFFFFFFHFDHLDRSG